MASIRTDRGLRLHVRGTSGYVDLADAADDERLATLTGLFATGDAGLAAARRASLGADSSGAMLNSFIALPPRMLRLELSVRNGRS